MTTESDTFKGRVMRVLVGRINAGTDVETVRKLVLIGLISAIAVANLIPLGIVAVVEGNVGLGVFDLTMAMVLAANLAAFRRHGNYRTASRFGIFSAAVLFFYLFITGGVNNTGILWYYTFPLFAAFLLGSREGLLATALLFLPSLGFMVIPGGYHGLADYGLDFKIRFIPSFLVVTAYSYLFEKFREKTQRNLAVQNEELERSERLLRHTFDAIPDLITVHDRDYRIVMSNWRGYEHVPPPQHDGRPKCYEIYRDRDRPCRFCPAQTVFQSGRPERVEVSGPAPGGVREINVYPVRDASGEVVMVTEHIRDVTEQRRGEMERMELERRLQRSRKMEALGTLAGGVAHDLNNILSGIVSYPELLLLEIPRDSPLRKAVLTIKKSGEKAATIVQDLLTLARRGVAASEVVDLNAIIEDYLKSPEGESLRQAHPGIVIETGFEPELLNILGSPIHLAKTVMNLIVNAAEAMPDGGVISLATANRYIDTPVKGYDSVKEGDYVVFTVSDTGIGIAAKDLEHIFEPFYTKKVMGKSGSGLGMAVVWGTVKDHNGYVDIESTESVGTTVKLYFPITRRGLVQRSSSTDMDAYHGSGESILVVDDVPEQRELASWMLTRLGYSVTTVSSGEEAVEFLEGSAPQLLILDMIMEPGIDGLETYRRIVQRHPGQKALIASGFSETERVHEAQRLGAGEYIKKPYTIEKIGVAVWEALRTQN
jgi:signal transduction histidine kinase/CheY-like chemotaxis protein/molybdopterin-binding protein